MNYRTCGHLCPYVATIPPGDRSYARLQYRRLRRGLDREDARLLWYSMFHIGFRAGWVNGHRYP